MHACQKYKNIINQYYQYFFQDSLIES